MYKWQKPMRFHVGKCSAMVDVYEQEKTWTIKNDAGVVYSVCL